MRTCFACRRQSPRKQTTVKTASNSALMILLKQPNVPNTKKKLIENELNRRRNRALKIVNNWRHLVAQEKWTKAAHLVSKQLDLEKREQRLYENVRRMNRNQSLLNAIQNKTTLNAIKENYPNHINTWRKSGMINNSRPRDPWSLKAQFYYNVHK